MSEIRFGIEGFPIFNPNYPICTCDLCIFDLSLARTIFKGSCLE